MRQRPLFEAPLSKGPAGEPEPPPRVYTVSELNSEFKFLLESTYPSIWVKGEISNFQQPVSRHFYFSLKDDGSQIRVVMWKSTNRFMKWIPANGMQVIVNGRLTVYEPRGEYQIDAVQIIPQGKGDLFAAFEQLKAKLQTEGLFDPNRKRPIPMLPTRIGIITSPTGAVIQDMLNILERRFHNLRILIFPAKVQGEEAALSIVEGIRVLNRSKKLDVLILARGGGSLEDLWPFNEEIVARAIVASRIPLISAVGHETDTTIADYVADLRAPTPSAAAELVIQSKSRYYADLEDRVRQLQNLMQTKILNQERRLNQLKQNRAFAGIPGVIHTFQQQADDFTARLQRGLSRYHQIQERRMHQLRQNLNAGQLKHLVEIKRSALNRHTNDLNNALRTQIHQHRSALGHCAAKLDTLSPLAVLERGYSITSNNQGVILKDSGQTAVGESVEVRLQTGSLKCEVKEVRNGGKN